MCAKVKQIAPLVVNQGSHDNMIQSGRKSITYSVIDVIKAETAPFVDGNCTIAASTDGKSEKSHF